MPRRRNLEQEFHRQVADYLALALNPATTTWTTFPLGGGGHTRGAILSGLGVRPGWPDVQIIHLGRFYAIELKASGGTLSADQIACHAAIRQAGGGMQTVDDIWGVLQALNGFGIPTRARPT